MELIPFKCLLVKYCKHKCFYNTIILFQPFALTCVPFLVPLLQFRCFLFFPPLHSILFLSVTPPFLQAFAFSQGPPLSPRSYSLLLPNFGISSPPLPPPHALSVFFVLFSPRALFENMSHNYTFMYTGHVFPISSAGELSERILEGSYKAKTSWSTLYTAGETEAQSSARRHKNLFFRQIPKQLPASTSAE